jgi:hypothetical protein
VKQQQQAATAGILSPILEQAAASQAGLAQPASSQPPSAYLIASNPQWGAGYGGPLGFQLVPPLSGSIVKVLESTLTRGIE